MTARRRGDESSRDELSRLLIAVRGDRSQQQVADLAGLKQSRVSRAERGRFPLPVEEAVAYAQALGATPEQRRRIKELAEAKTAQNVRGRATLIRVAAALQERIDHLEQDHTSIRSWDPAIITGSLQTTAYTAALLAGDDDGSDPGPAWWIARRRRTDRVHETGRTWHFLVAEAALRWTLGTAAVMRDQLGHLLTVAELPTVTLGIVPLAPPKGFVSPRGFHLYGTAVASVATDAGSSFLDEADDVEHFERVFDRLTAVAVYDDDARVLVRRIRDSYLEQP